MPKVTKANIQAQDSGREVLPSERRARPVSNAIWGLMHKYRFMQLTVLLFIVLMFAPLFTENMIISVLAELTLLDSLVVAVGSSRNGRMMRWPLLCIWALAISSFALAVWLGPSQQSTTAFMVATILYALYCFGCAAGVLAFVAEKRQGVTLDSLLASVAAYILLCLGFSCLFCLLLIFDPTSFNPPITVSPAHPVQLYLTMIYFSLVTLTTVGYGNIAPHSGFAQTFSGVEALIGQLYLAILVAYLVGSTLSARLKEHMLQNDPTELSVGGGCPGTGSE